MTSAEDFDSVTGGQGQTELDLNPKETQTLPSPVCTAVLICWNPLDFEIYTALSQHTTNCNYLLPCSINTEVSGPASSLEQPLLTYIRSSQFYIHKEDLWNLEAVTS